MKAQMAENDKKQDATYSQLKISLNEVEDKVENCCKGIIWLKKDKSLMDPEVLRSDLNQKMTAHTKEFIKYKYSIGKHIQELLKRTKELA